jgi:hypothetical protein
MDHDAFDTFARTLSETGSRRGVLGLLATLPVLGGLCAFLTDADETGAKGRRKRRKKPHHHRKKTGNRSGNTKKRRCKPESKAKTCSGTCGSVKNNCKKTVDCGSCDCPAACEDCFICQSGPNTPGECVVDPEQQGEPCGVPGQVCQADGTCACDTDSCPACTTCGDDGLCAGCTGCCDGETCVTDCGECRTCEAGQCHGCPDCCDAAGVCRDGDTDEACGSSGTCDVCTGQEECQQQQCVCVPDCTGKVCGSDGCTGLCNPGCGPNSTCSSDGMSCPCDFASCDDACCADGQSCCDRDCVDLQNDPDHCGDCETACDDGQTCQDGACGVSCGGTFCPVATAICLAGVYQACDVTCADGACAGATLQEALNAGGTVVVCPGRYTGSYTFPVDVTVIGAGEGDDPRVDTILDAQQSGRVVDIPASRTVALRQLRITEGRTSESFGGAGIKNFGTLLTMTDCTVSHNQTNVNLAEDARGGGIATSGLGRLEMTRCTVRNNAVTNTGSDNGHGGGIFNVGVLVMTDSVIRNNTAKSRAGGLWNDQNTTVTLTGCKVTENILTNPESTGGGGIWVNKGVVSLFDSYVWNNTGSQCAGGIIGSGCGVAPPA